MTLQIMSKVGFIVRMIIICLQMIFGISTMDPDEIKLFVQAIKNPKLFPLFIDTKWAKPMLDAVFKPVEI